MRLPLPQFAGRDRPPSHFAEVIETSTTEFLAQCLEPEDLSFPAMPAFGSWVRAQDEESSNQIYAVVYHATASPIDSVHRARALGMSMEELREEQPQIFAMLKTEFSAAIVGFRTRSPSLASASVRESNPLAPAGLDKIEPDAIEPDAIEPDAIDPERIYQYLPPRPPQIHQAVQHCTPEEVLAFTEKLDFLRTLLQVQGAPNDSLLAAAIRGVYRMRQADRQWLIRAGRALTVLLKDDYDRLRIILSQIHL